MLRRKSEFRPEPLKRRVLRPTLAEWMMRESADPQPYIWLRTEQHLRRALALAPGHPEAAVRLGRILLHQAIYCLHELPTGLLCDADEISAAIAEARGLFKFLPPEHVREETWHKLVLCEQLLAAYLAYRAYRSPPQWRGKVDFEAWATARGLPTSLWSFEGREVRWWSD
jgi:hypothetical protein